ncbi:ParA family protein [Paraburkholderia graminis]|uniref:ParA family protein n=1 Tax=Paraburkholderia graminis TaxID=60548 RepID=UPI0038B84318
MNSYSFWNNKGGVGKSFLCFIAACEYAQKHPETDIYVIDLCPQANVSETLLGGLRTSPKPMSTLLGDTPRRTVAGYLEERLSSPFRMILDVERFVSQPAKFNSYVPKNLFLICGDNLLELLSEPIRQASQLSLPHDAWAKTINWIRDLCVALEDRSGGRDATFIIDCNPSFAVYTQLALAGSDSVVVPYTADDSSRRGIENVIALLYGVGDTTMSAYAKLSFAQKAREENVSTPKIHTLVSNRQTLYDGKPSKAFEALSKTIKKTVDSIHKKHRSIFSFPAKLPSSEVVNIPDYHGASIVSAANGIPLHRLKAGPHDVAGDRVQINPDPLSRYTIALQKFVARL